MTGRFRGIVFSSEMDAEIGKLSIALGINHSAAVRMLCGRALGRGMGRLLVDEKVLEVKKVINTAFLKVLNEGLRQELHAIVDQVDPPTVDPLVDVEAESVREPGAEAETEEAIEEPAPAPMKGRPRRKAAKARRR